MRKCASDVINNKSTLSDNKTCLSAIRLTLANRSMHVLTRFTRLYEWIMQGESSFPFHRFNDKTFYRTRL